MKEPSICFVSRKWPPAIGGMETYAEKLSRELAGLASLSRIVLPGLPDGSAPRGWRLVRFGLSAAVRLLLAPRPAEIVHVCDMASWPLALAARLRSRRSGIAISAHGTDVSFPRRRGLKALLYRHYLRLAARLLPDAVVIANSESTAACAREAGFARLTIVPLATDLRGAAPDGHHDGALLFVGRWMPQKGGAWFVREVLPRLPAGITLRVAGPLWDKADAACLDNPRVTYLGALRGADLVAAYASALCVVVPNVPVPTGEFEGFGLVATEAAAAGGLVLAARFGGLQEAVIDGCTGFHLPPGDADAWAAKILELRSWSVERRVQFLAGAMAAVQREFAWERVGHDTVRAYDLARPAGCRRHA